MLLHPSPPAGPRRACGGDPNPGHLLVRVEADAGEQRLADDGLGRQDAHAAHGGLAEHKALAQQREGREQEERQHGDQREQVNVVQRALRGARPPR